MDLQNLVADYASKAEHGAVINMAALAGNEEFRQEVIEGVLKYLEKHQGACVLLPSYGIVDNRNPHLCALTNELAAKIAIKTLVTGDAEAITGLRKLPEDVIIIKQAFRTGEHLAKDVEILKKHGCNVGVLCLIAHSGAHLQNFGHQYDVEISALVQVDEIRYLQ
jgi:orotate phosphoribosyltransferase